MRNPFIMEVWTPLPRYPGAGPPPRHYRFCTNYRMRIFWTALIAFLFYADYSLNVMYYSLKCYYQHTRSFQDLGPLP